MANINDIKYEKLTINDVIDWCVENNQVEWLKATAEKEVEIKEYPKKEVTLADGKVVMRADRKATPTKKMVKMPFTMLKHEFCKKFFPDKLPKEEAKNKPSMLDRIRAL